MPGSVIIVHGASSAGKSTLAKALQAALPRPFLFFSLDAFLFGDVLPRTPDGPVRDWEQLRPKVLHGFYRCVRALAEAGNDVAVELIIEDRAQLAGLEEEMSGLDVFWVGLHVPVEELERRERERGDRRPGDARRDARTVHTFRDYDLDLDGTAPVEDNVRQVVATWSGQT